MNFAARTNRDSVGQGEGRMGSADLGHSVVIDLRRNKDGSAYRNKGQACNAVPSDAKAKPTHPRQPTLSLLKSGEEQGRLDMTPRQTALITHLALFQPILRANHAQHILLRTLLHLARQVTSSSRMKYAFWKLKMMSSSQTLP